MVTRSPMSNQTSPSIRLSAAFIWSVLAICVAPFFLNLLGVDFGDAKVAFPFSTAQDMAPSEHVDGMFHMLAGSFTPAILEWAAFCPAIFTREKVIGRGKVEKRCFSFCFLYWFKIRNYSGG